MVDFNSHESIVKSKDDDNIRPMINCDDKQKEIQSDRQLFLLIEFKLKCTWADLQQ